MESLDLALGYAVANIENAIDAENHNMSAPWCWGLAESWFRKAEVLMRNGA